MLADIASLVTWSTNPVQNTATATGLTQGVYTVTVASGACETILTDSITSPSPITATTASVDVSCYGGSNGCLTVTAAGGVPPYINSWSTGTSQSSACQLSAGTYADTIYDHNGCRYVVSNLTLTQPSAGNAYILHNGNSLIGLASGGTPPYHYEWNGSISGDTIANATPGNYLVEVFDANGCADTASFIILSDMTGRKVYEAVETNMKDKTEQIDLSMLSKGLYIITLKTAGGTANQRIVLK